LTQLITAWALSLVEYIVAAVLACFLIVESIPFPSDGKWMTLLTSLSQQKLRLDTE
jgi:hypothetical protein